MKVEKQLKCEAKQLAEKAVDLRQLEEQLKKMKSDLQSQSESLEQCFPVLNEHLWHLTKEFHEIQAPP